MSADATHPPQGALTSSHAPADTTAPDRALGPMRRALRLASLAAIAVMLAMPGVQVVLRQVLGTPFVGAEELTRFMLICLVFVTFPYVVASGANIRLEEGLHLLPRGVQQGVRVLIAASSTAVLAVAAASVLTAMFKNLQNATPTLGIPYYVFFSAAFVGFAAAGVECALQLWKVLAGRPLYVTFADEAPPDDLAALEAALTAEAGRGAREPRP